MPMTRTRATTQPRIRRSRGDRLNLPSKPGRRAMARSRSGRSRCRTPCAWFRFALVPIRTTTLVAAAGARMGWMTRRLFIFDDPDRFVAGTVGEPGDRAFFLQARKGGALVSVGIEKTQVAALAARMEDLLDAVEAPSPPLDADDHPLEEPVVERSEERRVGKE